VVALFGPTTREWGFYPVGGHNRILELALPCRPCALHGEGKCALDHACMKGIGVDEVMRAIEQINIENVHLLCKDLPANPCREISAPDMARII
jgi:ADP-heptose:LPS heptosyltransferase